MNFSFKRFWRLSSIFVVVGFIGADVFAMATKGLDATFSRYVLGVSEQYPVIPLAAGVVLGHLFWPQRKTDNDSKTTS
jgi:hypothetical protein